MCCSLLQPHSARTNPLHGWTQHGNREENKAWGTPNTSYGQTPFPFTGLNSSPAPEDDTSWPEWFLPKGVQCFQQQLKLLTMPMTLQSPEQPSPSAPCANNHSKDGCWAACDIYGHRRLLFPLHQDPPRALLPEHRHVSGAPRQGAREGLDFGFKACPQPLPTTAPARVLSLI